MPVAIYWVVAVASTCYIVTKLIFLVVIFLLLLLFLDMIVFVAIAVGRFVLAIVMAVVLAYTVFFIC